MRLSPLPLPGLWHHRAVTLRGPTRSMMSGPRDPSLFNYAAARWIFDEEARYSLRPLTLELFNLTCKNLQDLAPKLWARD
jgi:hypothetical protein